MGYGMDELKNTMLSEISHTQKEENCDFTYVNYLQLPNRKENTRAGDVEISG